MTVTLSLWQEFVLALIKEAPKLLSGAALLIMAWIGTRRFTNRWNLRQKAREIDLAASNDFHALYGEFFAVWKLWNAFVRDIGADALAGSSRWELLKRAADAEGKMEAMIVRIVSSKHLLPKDSNDLGEFRQLYQRLRESIRANKPLPWDRSDHAEYARFKQLAPTIAALIRRGSGMRLPQSSSKALRDITDNRHELPASVTRDV